MDQSETHMETPGKRNLRRCPRVTANQVHMVTQEDVNHKKERNHMATEIPIATHKMATHIEYEPLPWYLVNAVIDPDTGEVLKYKDIMK